MKDMRAAIKVALLRKTANEMQLPDLLRQSSGSTVDLEETEDPRVAQVEARLAEAKIAKQEAKADGGDVDVATERQKAELSKEKLMIEEKRAENERLKLELEGHKLVREKEDLAQEEDQRQAEAVAMQQQQQQADMPQPDAGNAMQQAAMDLQNQQGMPKVAGAAPYFFGLPSIYSLKMFESPLRRGDNQLGDN
jgi:hypothetical protein